MGRKGITKIPINPKFDTVLSWKVLDLVPAASSFYNYIVSRGEPFFKSIKVFYDIKYVYAFLDNPKRKVE